MNVIEMVKAHLTREGFDGLGCMECACEIADIAPCGNIGHDCVASYRHWCEDADCEYTADAGMHWHMRTTK